MQRLMPAISKGHAVITADELRCAAPRKDELERTCNKMIAKINQVGHIAGNFQCERCKEVIEVRMVPVASAGSKNSTRGYASPGSSKQYPRFGETQNNQPTREVSP